MNDQNKLTIKTKERAKQFNERTNELVAASLFDSNLFIGESPNVNRFPVKGIPFSSKSEDLRLSPLLLIFSHSINPRNWNVVMSNAAIYE